MEKLTTKDDRSIFINFTNRIDMNSSIHWHGIKLNNKQKMILKHYIFKIFIGNGKTNEIFPCEPALYICKV